MLRRIKVRLHPRRAHSSAAQARIQHDEPYGQDYGAGPSRLPYQPPSPSVSSSRQGPRLFRQKLDSLSTASYGNPEILTGTILKSMRLASLKSEEYIASLSTLELHILVHHLIRNKKGKLATSVVVHALRAAPRMARRNRVHVKTLKALFADRSIFHLTEAKPKPKNPKYNLKPTLLEQQPPPPSPRLQSLLDLLDLLQDVRYLRTPEMYDLIIRACCAESQPHIAAKIYVGLVEEWVTEGRVAEGASPEDFHPGGGPPREWVEWKQERGARWWTGIRTWKWPGEVLSPHDRLDLWHPRNIALPEKMRNFPVPLATSPPSIVPAPHSGLLNTIVSSLDMNPRLVTPHEFASSMRALAILANTVLSRTLPILALRHLLQAAHRAPFKPDVFPESLLSKPEDDDWAFTAFTQTHVMLMSLLWRPPMSASNMGMIQAAHEAEQRVLPSPDLPPAINSENLPVPLVQDSPYKLPPLSWSSSLVLLSYGFRSLRAPDILAALLGYMKAAFKMGGRAPDAWNIILGGASRLKQHRVAEEVGGVLFSDLAPPSPEDQMDKREFFSRRRMAAQGDITKVGGGLNVILPEEKDMPEPNEASVLEFIKHLSSTSQFSRLEALIYQLIPYLASEKAELGEGDEEMGLVVGESGRLKSSRLTPRIYTSLLKGLENVGKPGLAQRVYNIALYSERGAFQDLLADDPLLSAPPPEMRLPQEAFTTLMRTYAQREPALANGLSLTGVKLPRGSSRLPPVVGLGVLALELHGQVRKRWVDEWVVAWEMKGAKGKRYFDALIRCCWARFDLSTCFPSPKGITKEFAPLTKQVEREMVGVIKDMERWGLDVPKVLVKRIRKEYVEEGERGDEVIEVRREAEEDDLEVAKKDTGERSEARKLMLRIMGTR
ncbi:hypothetical protein B9479_004647 [Cryptococcus floricola]|uniref:Uncharacterized protein n=1 Tax=Cryptococcus floricola TaxID=2591691 RepID=A0A5D3AT84_9TREE|nr:hypothetical protein B9479_004647 [Cryptococcus floricola]